MARTKSTARIPSTAQVGSSSRHLSPPTISLDGMSDTEMKASIVALEQLFPDFGAVEIRNAIVLAKYDLGCATDILAGHPRDGPEFNYSPVASSSSLSVERRKALTDRAEIDNINDTQRKADVENLLDAFSHCTAEHVHKVLEGCRYNRDAAAEELLSLSPPSAEWQNGVSGSREKKKQSANNTGRSNSPDTASVATADPKVSRSPSPPGPALPFRAVKGIFPRLRLRLRSESKQPGTTLSSTADSTFHSKIKRSRSLSDASHDDAFKDAVMNVDASDEEDGDHKTPVTVYEEEDMYGVSDNEDTEKRKGVEENGKAKAAEDVVAALAMEVDSSDMNREAKIDHLHTVFRKASKNECANALQMVAGDMDKALSRLGKGAGKKGKAKAVEDVDTDVEEEPSEMTTEQKIAHLYAIFPKAGKIECGNILQIAGGKMSDAFSQLEEDFGHQLVGGDEDADPDIGPSRRKRRLKRRCDLLEADRCLKRSRGKSPASSDDDDADADDEGDVAGLEPASQWVRTMWNSSDGVLIRLDSGTHSCKIPESSLRKFNAFRRHFDDNPEEAAKEKNLTVPNVSRQTFDLALQWAICHNGSVERAQRRNKSHEIAAFVDLAVFAADVGLKLGDYFTKKVKSILLHDRDSLRGNHITEAFGNLQPNHPLCKLFVETAWMPYAEFYRKDEGVRRADIDSDSDDDVQNLNSAQRQAYYAEKFCYQREFDNVERFHYALLDEFHKSWANRTVTEQRYGKLLHNQTELMDPLTLEPLIIGKAAVLLVANASTSKPPKSYTKLHGE